MSILVVLFKEQSTVLQGGAREEPMVRDVAFPAICLPCLLLWQPQAQASLSLPTHLFTMNACRNTNTHRKREKRKREGERENHEDPDFLQQAFLWPVLG